MFLFINGTATTEIYTLSLHDALPICLVLLLAVLLLLLLVAPCLNCLEAVKKPPPNNLDMAPPARAEAIPPAIAPNINQIGRRFSRNAETDVVCRLLLEKKKTKIKKNARKYKYK